MKDRTSLTGTPELGLKNAITYHDSVDEYGHRVYEALQRVSEGKVGSTDCSNYLLSFSMIFLCQ